MSEGSVRPLRVLQIVSSGGVTSSTQQSLFMPLAMRLPKQRVKTQIVCLSPDALPAAVLRQAGIPVHDVALSRHRFSASAFKDLLGATATFRPDVIQAWGHTAQIASSALRSRCDWKPHLIWSVAETTPLPAQAGLIDRQKLKLAARLSSGATRIVYTSEAAASSHRRVGFPEGEHVVIPPGVDPMRFKPDFASRRKVREQLGLPHDAFVVGMLAPFQTEFDHVTLLRAAAELIKTIPNLYFLLAGHGVQKGNGPLMALVGANALGARTHLLGEWTDSASFYNACDVACSSATVDSLRMNMVVAMLCGVPCVATGVGAQGELLGQFGVAIEKSSQGALVRGITRIMQLLPERRAFMAKGARKHALQNYVQVRSLQKYLQLYFDLVGREVLAATDVPTQEIDEAIPEPSAEELAAARVVAPAKAANAVSMAELADPDSLELQAKSFEAAPSTFFTPPPPRPEVLTPPKPEHEGDVLQSFESSLKLQAGAVASPMSERARGVADDLGDLLAPEELHSDEPAPGPRPTIAPPVTRRPSEMKPSEIIKKSRPATVPSLVSSPIPAIAVAAVPKRSVSETREPQQLDLTDDPPAPLLRAMGNVS